VSVGTAGTGYLALHAPGMTGVLDGGDRGAAAGPVAGLVVRR
jgi:hypothetical protein